MPDVTTRWVPANRKWSPTIRIDDYCHSANFYLSIDLLYQFENHIEGSCIELPPDDGIIPILSSYLLDSNKVLIGIDNIGETLRLCMPKPEADTD